MVVSFDCTKFAIVPTSGKILLMDDRFTLAFQSLILSCAILATNCIAQTEEPFEADCLIEPTQQVAIGSPVTGVLDQVLVKRGAKVSKGQIIGTLMSSVEQAAVQLAQYKSEQTAALQLAERKQEFTKRKFERRQTMAAERLMPEQDSDDAESDYRLAEAELLVARESHQIALYEYRQQKAQLEQKTIRSPLSGVVVEQSAYPGEVVEPGGNSKPVLKLAQLDPLRVQVILPKQRFGKIVLGAKVDVMPENPISGKYKAKVKTVDRLLDAASGTFVVFLELPNPKLSIPAGVKCQAHFTERQ
jgi:RND family efflux transporter MFP subunit